MGEHIVKILRTENVTHNVKRFTVERPLDYTFQPGQATDVCINLPSWKNELRPFTFTGLQDWDHLEFTIKIYRDHPGVTHQLGTLKSGDEIILHDVFGAIHYYGEGTFIAGGAGITPFIAILRHLNQTGTVGNNKLIFSNKTQHDIILKAELTQWLGTNFITTLTQDKTKEYDSRRINKDYLMEKIKSFNQYFYLCGPDPMVEDLQRLLLELGAEKKKVIVEQF